MEERILSFWSNVKNSVLLHVAVRCLLLVLLLAMPALGQVAVAVLLGIFGDLQRNTTLVRIVRESLGPRSSVGKGKPNSSM
jgi:hypothetical protein